jgi:Flp pilus assembly protein TadD
VPAFVSLSLGSAHFRSGNLPAAETAWLETVAANPRVGEAHNNLAVVYLETGRFDEAERAVTSAERAAFRVSPDLKQEIRRRRKTGGR